MLSSISEREAGASRQTAMPKVSRRALTLAASATLVGCGTSRPYEFAPLNGAEAGLKRGYTLLSLGEYQTIRVLNRGKLFQKTIPSTSPRWADWIVWDVCPGGGFLLVERFGETRQLEVWNWRGSIVGAWRGSLSPDAICHRLSPDGHSVASLKRRSQESQAPDGRILVRSLRDGKQRDYRWTAAPARTHERMEWSPDSSFILFTDEGRITTLARTTGEISRFGEGLCASWHPNGKEILVLTRSRMFELREMASRRSRVLMHQEDALDGGEFGPDGRHYLVAKTATGLFRTLSSAMLLTPPPTEFRLHKLDGTPADDVGLLPGGSGVKDVRWVRCGTNVGEWAEGLSDALRKGQ